MSRTEVGIQRGKLAVIVVNGGSSSIIPIQVQKRLLFSSFLIKPTKF